MYQVLDIGWGDSDKNNVGALRIRGGSNTYDTLGELYSTFRQNTATAFHTDPRGRRAYIEFSSIILRIGPPEVDE